MLSILPDIQFPITSQSINPLFNSIVQLNKLDAAIQEPWQRAIGIYLHVFDLYVKSGGRIDYRGVDGHERLKDDAARFVPSAIVTRHGDLPAAHLAIDFSDTCLRCDAVGLPRPSADVHQLLADSKDLMHLSLEMEKRVGLLLDMLGKRPVPA